MGAVVELHPNSPHAVVREAQQFLEERNVHAVMVLLSWGNEQSDAMSSIIRSDGFTLESLLVMREILTKRINDFVADAHR